MNPAEFANISESEKSFWWYRGMRKILFRLLDPHLDDRTIRRALEAGCGTGYFARLLQAERRLPLFPIDLGWEGLRRARAMGVQNAAQANILNLPFADRSFDLVLSLDVLPHLPRGMEQRGVDELCRVLAPGGIVAIRSAALEILRSRHSEFVLERQRFTRDQLADAVKRCGVRVLRATYANALLMPIALAKFRLWEPLTRQAPSSGVAPVAGWLDSLLYSALGAECAWLASGRNLPIGQTIILIGEKA
jgi:SAM-dependent methyltransferase